MAGHGQMLLMSCSFTRRSVHPCGAGSAPDTQASTRPGPSLVPPAELAESHPAIDPAVGRLGDPVAGVRGGTTFPPVQLRGHGCRVGVCLRIHSRGILTQICQRAITVIERATNTRLPVADDTFVMIVLRISHRRARQDASYERPHLPSEDGE